MTANVREEFERWHGTKEVHPSIVQFAHQWLRGAWAAWQHQQVRIADLTRQLAEREAMLTDIEAALGHAGENVGERLVSLEAEVSRYQGELLEALRERDEARERIAEMEPHSRWYKHREEINRRKNGSPCCCEFDDDDEPITQCAFHADLWRELAEARALLAETGHPQ